MSSRATTRTTLARIRREQGRPDDAEALLREAIEIFASTEYRVFQATALRELAQLLRERGRDDEADAFEVRLRDVADEASAARIA
jgi:ATP/maltotriose-dependent transcriptional regulator MalT